MSFNDSFSVSGEAIRNVNFSEPLDSSSLQPQPQAKLGKAASPQKLAKNANLLSESKPKVLSKHSIGFRDALRFGLEMSGRGLALVLGGVLYAVGCLTCAALTFVSWVPAANALALGMVAGYHVGVFRDCVVTLLRRYRDEDDEVKYQSIAEDVSKKGALGAGIVVGGIGVAVTAIPRFFMMGLAFLGEGLIDLAVKGYLPEEPETSKPLEVLNNVNFDSLVKLFDEYKKI